MTSAGMPNAKKISETHCYLCDDSGLVCETCEESSLFCDCDADEKNWMRCDQCGKEPPKAKIERWKNALAILAAAATTEVCVRCLNTGYVCAKCGSCPKGCRCKGGPEEVECEACCMRT